MHEEQKELIDRLLDGELNTEEEQNLREHLRGCNDCFSYYVQMKHMRDALAEQKAERLDETWMNGMKQKLKKERSKKRWGTKRIVLYAAGLIVVAMLGFGASEAVSLWGGQNSDSAYEGDYLTDSNSDSSYTVSGDGELTSDSDGTKSSDETTTETGTIDADKIIYTGSLTLYADDFNATANSIKSYVQGLGGFIQSSTYYDSGNSASAYTASGTLVLRVPSDLFDDVMEQMATYGDVTNETTDSSNISQTYQDLEAELESYQIQEERLLTYLSEAESISDMMTIESQLTSVRTQINSLQTTLNNLDNQISYSTITVYLYEQESETIDSPFGSFFQDIKTAFAQSLNFLLDALAFLLLWIVRLAPFAAIAVGIAYLVRVIRRKRMAKTSAAVPRNAEKSDGEAQ